MELLANTQAKNNKQTKRQHEVIACSHCFCQKKTNKENKRTAKQLNFLLHVSVLVKAI